ncbi:hypothetical protein BDZ85DRAFT_259994 [Elsinoe ampelina]|uniref:Uncharacterized protein n=1 Tax=Elsinoe ampelina TaxID=302913 RepID=A0A6A6GI21_9PEZI|nr:hypothetical protein BDZ85DRAFT_259994 [Elsinoe ampelina]
MLVTTARGGLSVLFLLLIPVVWLGVYHFPALLTFDSASLPQKHDQVIPVKEESQDVKEHVVAPEKGHVSWVEPAPVTDSESRLPVESIPWPPAEQPAETSTQPGYHVIKSKTSLDGRYFDIDFKHPAINPNIIPHPTEPDTFIIVAQKHKYGSTGIFFFVELVCNAVFQNYKLVCTEPASILPISATSSGNCEGKLDFFALSVGPHDARVFWGPDRPYVLFGSNSMHNCFGQWLQDFRMLTIWHELTDLRAPYRLATDIAKPPPYQPIEKNWFIFWDLDSNIYAHYDIFPHRSFARISPDGSASEDLAPRSREADDMCFATHGPKPTPASPDAGEGEESIHQATNSLSITLCRRADPSCEPSPTNTFILTVFHLKRHLNLHSVYEPYVLLFSAVAPFRTFAVGSKPLWVHGRKKAGEEGTVSDGQSEMMYITSVNWKANGSRYQGYLDDVVMVGFGVEDRRAAGIDVLAEDLLGGLAYC